MSVKLDTRQIGDVTVVDAAGRIVAGDAAATLRDTVRELAAKGHNRVVFNLAEVAYIDSSGIGELVAACTSIINQGGSVKLLNLNERVRTVFTMTKLHMVFPIFDDEKTALTSFN